MGNKILILFAHPRLETSRANAHLLRNIPSHPDITFNDLYEHYPDFNIDVEREKKLLGSHDIIIWHHPLYWYSSPPLLKAWIDLVLEYGWAYGPGGKALRGKILFQCFTSGGAREVYSSEGYNRYTIPEFLRPFERTVTLCNMIYLPPFAIQGTHRLSDEDLAHQASFYGDLLIHLVESDIQPEEISKHEFMLDWFKQLKNSGT